MNNHEFEYSFYCVAFIDILGQRDKIRQLKMIESEDELDKLKVYQPRIQFVINQVTLLRPN